MLRNYFKTALRNLSRNRAYAMINISGLAIGLAVCMMIFVVIQFQTSYDNFHSHKDRIYRVITRFHNEDRNTTSSKGVPFPLPRVLKTSFPQLEEVTTVYASHNDQLQVLDDNGNTIKSFKEENGVFYTDPSFFKTFNFPLLAGSYSSLKDPNHVLLTKETANLYFGDWKLAVGKTLKLTGFYRMGAGLFQFPPIPLKVSGVLETIPGNTDFQLKMAIAFGTDFTGDKENGFQTPDWVQAGPDYSCFLVLPEKISAEQFNQQLTDYTKKIQPADNKDTYHLQALKEIHYDQAAGNFSGKVISTELLNVLWLIAAFILLIACVNFINLSTAQAVNRAKEVSVRKVLGGNRFQLQLQFLTESFLIVLVAVVLAAVITFLSLPIINGLLDLSIPSTIFRQPVLLIFLTGVTIVVTLLAGFYPSVVLSGFNPINALKNKFAVSSTKGISLRRGLVVFQFIIAQALIIGTLIVVKQMRYFTDQPLGFDKETVVNVPFRPDSTGSKLTDYLQQQLLSVKGVQSASFNSNTPMEEGNDMWTTFQFDNSTKDANFQAIVKFADTGYVPLYQLKVVAGRNLLPSMMTREFLVNESMAKSLGYDNPEDILNKEITMLNGLIKCPVVGVVRDFNDRSLRHGVAPLMITTNITMYRQVAIKLATSNMAATMESIRKVWQQAFPDYVYEYRFLDEKIESFYKQESQLADLYKIFAIIAIFLSCLGLYGLASFMAVQRIKEVGIRKVLGAGVTHIVFLFSREFIVLILIAFLVAVPISWYFMQQWLQGYVYRIQVSWWYFAVGGSAAVFIALATISFQAIKAALANPIRSLRKE